MAVFKWVSRIAVVATTALSVWRLWKSWQARQDTAQHSGVPAG
jgi:hypothetical protein